jgi:asparagine synthetase B (glutamine-hydrolysing)
MCGILIYQDIDINRHGSYCDGPLSNSPVFFRGPDSHVKHIISYPNSRVLTVNSILSIKSKPGDVPQSLQLSSSDDGSTSVFLYNGESYESSWHGQLDTDNFQVQSNYGSSYIYESNPAYRGFFAYAAVKSRKIYFSVDLLSEKSLFWYSKNGIFILGSSLATVLHVLRSIGMSPRLNVNTCLEYFYTRHLIQFPSTVWDGVYRVMPGIPCEHDIDTQITSTPTVSQSSEHIYLSVKRLFSYDSLEAITKIYIQDSLYDSKFSDASAFVLSGGIDSTLVSLLSTIYSSSQHSYWTLTFGSKDPAAIAACRLASSLGINYHSINVTPQTYRDALEKLSSRLCYPLPTHSFASYYILAGNVASSGARILYGGEGADEVYQGYSLYHSLRSSPGSNGTSISPYSSFTSRFPDFPADHTLLSPDVNIGYNTFYSLFCQDGYTYPVERASLLCDLTFQLASTGLLCVDDIGGLFGLESRSPLANLFAASRILFDRQSDFSACLGNGKKMLRSMLLEFDCANKVADLPKQGFSGYPNEIFDDFQTLVNCRYVFDQFSLDYKDFLPRILEGDLKWKINNLSIFLRSQV